MDPFEKPHVYTDKELEKLKSRTASDAAFLEDGGEYVNSANEPRLDVKQSRESIEARNLKAKQLLETIAGSTKVEEPSPEKPMVYNMFNFWSAFNTEEFYGTENSIRSNIIRSGRTTFLKWFRQREPELNRWQRLKKAIFKEEGTRTKEEIVGYMSTVGLARNKDEEENWFNFLENYMYPLLKKVRLEGDILVYKISEDYSRY
jgi:hypothetical protein